jgi:hypothetical protein
VYSTPPRDQSATHAAPGGDVHGVYSTPPRDQSATYAGEERRWTEVYSTPPRDQSATPAPAGPPLHRRAHPRNLRHAPDAQHVAPLRNVRRDGRRAPESRWIGVDPVCAPRCRPPFRSRRLAVRCRGFAFWRARVDFRPGRFVCAKESRFLREAAAGDVRQGVLVTAPAAFRIQRGKTPAPRRSCASGDHHSAHH